MKTVIFDFDGTIGDTLTIGLRIVNELADQYGFNKISERDVPRYQQMEVGQILKEVGVSLPKAIIVGRQVLKRMSEELDGVKIFEGIKEVIDNLRYQGYTVGIVTKNDLSIVEKILERVGVSVDFLERDDTFFNKEKAIEKALVKNNINKDEVVYVGDEVRDVEAAKKVGIPIISVTWGFNAKEILEKKNTLICFKPQELTKEIKKVLA